MDAEFLDVQLHEGLVRYGKYSQLDWAAETCLVPAVLVLMAVQELTTPDVDGEHRLQLTVESSPDLLQPTLLSGYSPGVPGLRETYSSYGSGDGSPLRCSA